MFKSAETMLFIAFYVKMFLLTFQKINIYNIVIFSKDGKEVLRMVRLDFIVLFMMLLLLLIIVVK